MKRFKITYFFLSHRPASGSMLLYNRKVVFYRRDGYCWKKRRNGSTIREDHMKLKVQGLEVGLDLLCPASFVCLCIFRGYFQWLFMS